MKPNKRQKLCQNCEGGVDLDVIVCPYCAADLREEKPEQAHTSYSNPLGGMQKSLYPPPYAARETEEVREEAAAVPPEKTDTNATLLPTLLVTLGAQLLLLALLMLLFSHKGVLILKWDARYWLLYALASAPMLYFGYRSLSKL